MGSPQPERPQPEKPQPDPKPEPQQPEQLEEEEEERPWVHKPFNIVIASYKQVKEQYLCLERILESISHYLNMEPSCLLEHIQALPKPQDLANLQALVDYFLKVNGELKTKVEGGEVSEHKKIEVPALA